MDRASSATAVVGMPGVLENRYASFPRRREVDRIDTRAQTRYALQCSQLRLCPRAVLLNPRQNYRCIPRIAQQFLGGDSLPGLVNAERVSRRFEQFKGPPVVHGKR
jgi:hypothetical protein